MRKESSAERALNRQLKLLRDKHRDLLAVKEAAKIRIEAVLDVINQFEHELSQSKANRLAASEARKPSGDDFSDTRGKS